MKNHKQIIDGIRLICIDMSKGIASNNDIIIVTNRHKPVFK